MLLNERLNVFGVLGCILCISGSLAIVLHAPEERPLTSVLQIWELALQPCEWHVLGLRHAEHEGQAAVHSRPGAIVIQGLRGSGPNSELGQMCCAP
jgi:hypothetical protein